MLFSSLESTELRTSKKHSLVWVFSGLFIALFVLISYFNSTTPQPNIATQQEMLAFQLNQSQEKIEALQVQIEAAVSRLNLLENSVASSLTRPLAETLPSSASDNHFQAIQKVAIDTQYAIQHTVKNALICPIPLDSQVIAPTEKELESSSTSSEKHHPFKYHTIQKGETLSSISQYYYGTSSRWKEIYDANKDKMSNKNHLKVGTQIVIPSLNAIPDL